MPLRVNSKAPASGVPLDGPRGRCREFGDERWEMPSVLARIAVVGDDHGRHCHRGETSKA